MPGSLLAGTLNGVLVLVFNVFFAGLDFNLTTFVFSMLTGLFVMLGAFVIFSQFFTNHSEFIDDFWRSLLAVGLYTVFTLTQPLVVTFFLMAYIGFSSFFSIQIVRYYRGGRL
jgi:hypothetical protein